MTNSNIIIYVRIAVIQSFQTLLSIRLSGKSIRSILDSGCQMHLFSITYWNIVYINSVGSIIIKKTFFNSLWSIFDSDSQVHSLSKKLTETWDHVYLNISSIAESISFNIFKSKSIYICTYTIKFITTD